MSAPGAPPEPGPGPDPEPASSAPRHTIDRLADHARVSETPGRPNAAARALLRWLGPLVRLLFRPRMAGWEHLPEGPFLLVANHSGGGVAEILCLAHLWDEHFGEERPLAGMSAPAVYVFPGLGFLLRSVGAIPSTYRHAEAAFASGAAVLLFPGGDHDAFRPLWKANEVDWNGRQGYLRLARAAGVPIVPLGFRGSHYTNPILWRSTLLPHLTVLPRLVFGVKRYPITLWSVLGAALLLGLAGPAWGYPLAAALTAAWLISPFVFVIPCLPWTVRGRLGPALPHAELFPPGEEGLVLSAANERVLAAVQSLVLARD
ncbi:MAG: 1-acyl-sn-glycerol-3-phosphate acyltransferase [Planctomycetota bacterium]